MHEKNCSRCLCLSFPTPLLQAVLVKQVSEVPVLPYGILFVFPGSSGIEAKGGGGNPGAAESEELAEKQPNSYMLS